MEHHDGLEVNRLLRFVENTPSSVLEERQRFKDAQMEARRLEVQWERQGRQLREQRRLEHLQCLERLQHSQQKALR